jgi:hypothetical protein
VISVLDGKENPKIKRAVECLPQTNHDDDTKEIYRRYLLLLLLLLLIIIIIRI